MKKKIFMILLSVISIMSFSAVMAAADTENFENYTTDTPGSTFRGTGKLFSSISTIPAESLSVKTETNGTYTNNYLSVTGNAGDGILVGQTGILQYDVTLIQSRLKFTSGSSQTVVLRSSSSSTDIPVLAFDGTSKISLAGNTNCYTDFTAESWYYMYAFVDKNEGTLKVTLVKEKDHSVLSAQKTLSDTLKSYLNNTCGYRFRMYGPNKLYIDDISVSDAGECDGIDIAVENFEQFSEGSLSAASFSGSGLKILSQYYPCAEVIREQDSKILAVTGSSEQPKPFIYNLIIPDGTNILEFDMKVSADAASARAFLRSSTGSQVILTEYNQNMVKIAGVNYSDLAELIKADFVHFAFVITEGETGTAIKSYANGKYYGTTTYTLKYNDARFLVNSADVPADYSTSTLYLDNIRVHTASVSDAEYAPVYVNSESGNDLNDGTSAAKPLKTIAAAYELMDRAEKIIIMNDMTYTAPSSPYTGTVVIEGSSNDVTLTIPDESISLNGNLTIDNITMLLSGTWPKIYANGYELVIGENTVFDRRMEVYGGTGGDYTGDTHITLLGGQYSVVYGGCQTGILTGNTYLTVGGNVNKDDSTLDSDSNYYASYLHGGGRDKAVTGKTNITFQGNAVFAYIVGAGKEAEATVSESNIVMTGGRVMNILGGALTAPLTGCTINITMSGGIAEGIFGGSNSASMSGNVYVTLLGGEITRRVYTGCYDKGGNNYVSGSTTLVLTPNVRVNTAIQPNSGVFAGSRGASNSAEINTIIFLNGCYDAFKDEIGDVSGWGALYKSKEKYIVKAGAGGSISGTDTAGQIIIEPDEGKFGLIAGKAYYGGTASIAEGITEVTFADRYTVSSLSAARNGTGISAEAIVTAGVSSSDYPVSLLTAVYSADKRLIAVDKKDNIVSGNYVFNIDCAAEDGKDYYVSAMIWDKAQTPASDKKTAAVE